MILQNQTWIEEFKQRNRRSPKVLHIGNIANNAYNNAKLLNQVGLDNDVMCYDYYHIMGCPEWEDSNFDGNIQDDFHPNWQSVNLNGYKRPRWFAQGPFKIIIKYLIAKNLNDKLKQNYYWAELEKYNGYNEEGNLKRIEFFKNKIIKFVFKKLFKFMQIMGFFGKEDKKSKLDLKKIIEEYNTFNEQLDYQLYNLQEYELLPYLSEISSIRKLFEFYDIIEVYSTDPIWAFLANNKPYIAYEHGTIRDIPFEQNFIGALTAISYSKAAFSIITNPDCIKSAKRLKLDNYIYIPHVIDSKYSPQCIDKTRRKLHITQDKFVIFSPARQNWEVKGNDITIRAFAKFIANKKTDSILVLAIWGQDIEKSNELIKELNIEKYVTKINALKIPDLIDWINASDCIIDQYKGYFGGLAPSALACGKQLISYINYEEYDWAFTSMPPMYNARSVDDVYNALTEIYHKENKTNTLGIKWTKENYSPELVVNRHLECIKNILLGNNCENSNFR